VCVSFIFGVFEEAVGLNIDGILVKSCHYRRTSAGLWRRRLLQLLISILFRRETFFKGLAPAALSDISKLQRGELGFVFFGGLR